MHARIGGFPQNGNRHSGLSCGGTHGEFGSSCPVNSVQAIDDSAAGGNPQWPNAGVRHDLPLALDDPTSWIFPSGPWLEVFPIEDFGPNKEGAGWLFENLAKEGGQSIPILPDGRATLETSGRMVTIRSPQSFAVGWAGDPDWRPTRNRLGRSPCGASRTNFNFTGTLNGSRRSAQNPLRVRRASGRRCRDPR